MTGNGGQQFVRLGRKTIEIAAPWIGLSGHERPPMRCGPAYKTRVMRQEASDVCPGCGLE